MIKIEPVYFIGMNFVDCQAEVWCNDILVYKHVTYNPNERDSLAISVPVNHIILKNQEVDIKVKIFPHLMTTSFDEKTYVNVQFFIADFNVPEKDKIILLELKSPEIIKGLPYFELNGKSKATLLPFSFKGWTESIDFSKVAKQKLLIDVFNFYNDVKQIVEHKNIEKFFEISTDKDDLFFESMYMNTNDISTAKEGLIELFQKPNFSILPLDITDVNVIIMGNGKVLNLRRNNGMASIILTNPIERNTIELDFKIHKPKETSNFKIILS